MSVDEEEQAKNIVQNVFEQQDAEESKISPKDVATSGFTAISIFFFFFLGISLLGLPIMYLLDHKPIPALLVFILLGIASLIKCYTTFKTSKKYSKTIN